MKHSVGKKAAFAAAAAALAISVASCAEENNPGVDKQAEPQFGYALPQELVTTNAGTAVGVATDASKISARLVPGSFIEGPDQQLLPNADLVSANPSKRSAAVINYQINEEATYSDGKPVVCDDFLLTYEASKRPDLFGSDMPLFSQVENVDCKPGSKRFAVIFKPSFGERYRELFSSGTVLPMHTLA